MISSSDLKYFMEIARWGHLSRAAERLGISQPALTHSLKRIEISLGLELFIRSKKGMRLTQAGQRLFVSGEKLIEQWDAVIRSARNDEQTVSGVLRLGCHSAVAQYTLPKFFPKFLKTFPRIEVRHTHGLSRHMAEAVISDRLDVAIVVNPFSHPDLIIRELCRDVISLWKSTDCKNPKLLMLEPSLFQTQDILKKLNSKQWPFEQTLESPSLDVLAHLLKAGTGYAILPARVVASLGAKNIIEEKNGPHFVDRICLVYKPPFKRTQLGQTFIDWATRAIR